MYILICIVYLISVLTIQYIIWRYFLPRKEIFFLLIYLFSFPFFFLLILNFSVDISIYEKLLMWIFMECFGAFYFITFFGIQEESPSLSLISIIHNEKIRNINEIEEKFKKIKFIENRLLQLESDNLVTKTNKQMYSITSKGRFLVILSNKIRKILNISKTV